MEIEIKLKGCPYEDMDEIKIFIHARDMYSMIWDVRNLIRDRMNNDDTLTDGEDRFLENLLGELCLDSIELG